MNAHEERDELRGKLESAQSVIEQLTQDRDRCYSGWEAEREKSQDCRRWQTAALLMPWACSRYDEPNLDVFLRAASQTARMAADALLAELDRTAKQEAKP